MTLDVALQYAFSDQAPTTVSSPTRQRPSARRQPAALTRREEEISALVAQGLTNREVASELVISEHTAATHVRRSQEAGAPFPGGTRRLDERVAVLL